MGVPCVRPRSEVAPVPPVMHTRGVQGALLMKPNIPRFPSDEMAPLYPLTMLPVSLRGLLLT